MVSLFLVQREKWQYLAKKAVFTFILINWISCPLSCPESYHVVTRS